jgi:SAM-dependent methyltransferase
MECPICLSRPNEHFSAKYVEVAKCGKCGHIYASNVPEDHGVQAPSDPDVLFAQYGARNQRLIAKWVRDGLISKGYRVLDFGAGTGHILRSLVGEVPDLELDIHCIEADKQTSAFLKAQCFVVHEKLSDLTLASYDTILLVELIEHLIDPVDFLQNIQKYLSPNGKIFITTPIGETRTGNRNLTTYDTAEHVQFWTEGSFALACQKANLAFTPINPSIMYPRKNSLYAVLRDAARRLRDLFQGTRHLVGYVHRA